jgi:hypothetical protein
MGTQDDLFQFLLDLTTDPEKMRKLASRDHAQVEEALDGANLSETQKNVFRAASEPDLRTQLGVTAGFVYNQTGFSPLKWSGKGTKKAKKAKKATKAKKASKAASKSKGPAKKSAKKVAKKAARKAKKGKGK